MWPGSVGVVWVKSGGEERESWREMGAGKECGRGRGVWEMGVGRICGWNMGEELESLRQVWAGSIGKCGCSCGRGV